MPIITPAYPQQNSTFNVTKSTRTVMLKEFKRGTTYTAIIIVIWFFMYGTVGLDTCTDILLERKTWNDLFEPLQFFSLYKSVIIVISVVANV